MAKSKREVREQRVVSAKAWAQKHDSGVGKTSLNIPEGVRLFQIKKPGLYKLDFIPYITGKGNPSADEGVLYWERTYYVHRGIGANNESYCCPAKNWGKACPICEYRNKLNSLASKDPEDEKRILALAAKERQLFNVIDHDDRDAGIKLFEYSFYLFGKYLKHKIDHADEDDGYEFFADLNKGYTLRIGASEDSQGGYKFFTMSDIEFRPRRAPLPEDLIDKAVCLDDVPKEVSYESLKKVFEQTVGETEVSPISVKGKAKSNGKVSRKPVEEEEEEDDEDEDEDVEEEDEEDDEEEEVEEEEEAKVAYKVNDRVLYRGKECVITQVKADGSIYVEDEEGEDYKVKDASMIKPLEVEEEEEEEVSVKKKPGRKPKK